LSSASQADARDVAVYEAYDARLLAALKAGRTEEAFRIFDEELNGDYFKDTYYANTTRMVTSLLFIFTPPQPLHTFAASAHTLSRFTPTLPIHTPAAH
jgi:hypothetical protein